MRSVQINDIPKYDFRLVDLILSTNKPTEPRSDDEIDREFDKESWGRMLSEVEEKKPTSIEEIDALYCDKNEDLLISIKDELFWTKQKSAYQILIEIFEENLLNIAKGTNHYAELGCGYGSKIFNLMKRPSFRNKTFSAVEYTNNGQHLTALLAHILGQNIDVGHVDFNKQLIDKKCIPKDSIIFTSYALHYIRELNIEFWDFIDNLQPRAFIAFEPCYELYDDTTTLGLLRKKYHLKNRYTKNIASTFNDFCQQKQKRFRILPNVFGLNPLLPISVLIYEAKLET